MRIAASALLLLFVTLLQVTIVQHLAVGAARPDLVVLVVVSIALLGNSVVGAVHGFLGGLAFGVFAVVPLGPHALIGTLIGYVVGRWGEALVTEEHPAPPIIAGIVGTLGMYLGRPLVEFLVAPGSAMLDDVWTTAATVTIINAVIAVPTYLLVRRALGLVPDISFADIHGRAGGDTQ